MLHYYRHMYRQSKTRGSEFFLMAYFEVKTRLKEEERGTRREKVATFFFVHQDTSLFEEIFFLFLASSSFS